MRIAFVSTVLAYPWGGADALWTAAAESAAARGDQILIAVSEQTARNSRVGKLVEAGATLVIRPAPIGPTPFLRRAWRKIAGQAGQPDRLLGRLRAFAPDLVIFSCGGTYDIILEPALTAWLRASGTRYRIIANFQHEHPALQEVDRLKARELLIAAERIFSVSPQNLATTRAHLLAPLLNAESIHGCMVHNPLAPPSDLPWPVPPPWGFACIARLESVKGVDLLIRALAAGLGETPGWRLNVYGRGSQRNYLEECALFCGIGERVRFPGFVPRLDDIWEQNHILVSPAVDEGGPITIAEAMLRGRTALATRVGGAPEWIEPGVTGFICAAPTVPLLAASLREAWEQREHWREMGAAASVRARALYRPDDFKRIVA